ncbi:MAG: flavin reductase family protein [Acidobacteriaceae bacterium]|nr:flavin reductase family protein [Acidobacteriaceae bacterium]
MNARSRISNADSGFSAATARLFRRAASFIPSGVAILTTADACITVSSLHFVSSDPPMVSVALARDSLKGAAIIGNGFFHIRLLSLGEESVAKDEALPVGKGMVEMDCTVAAIYRAGDHNLVLARVGQTSISHGYPLIYWRRGLHPFQPRYSFLASREAFQEFVAAWEAGTLPKSKWTHAGHVAIGASYAVRFRATAFERTRNGILRHNEAVGTSNTGHTGYHETLTRLWSIVLAKVSHAFSDPWDAACNAVEKLGEDRDLHYLYYSFDIVRNEEARRVWVPPDLEGPY